jgi:hypothetical protein
MILHFLRKNKILCIVVCAKFYTPRAEMAIKMLFKQQLISTNELIINSSWLSKYSKKIISNISVGQSVKTQNPLL